MPRLTVLARRFRSSSWASLSPGGGEADAQALGLAEPALVFRFGDAGGQVVADAGQAWPLGWVHAEDGTPDGACSCGQLVP